MAKLWKILLFPLLVGSLLLAACAKNGPEPISFGRDNCANCGMMASDARFGAEIVTSKGKILKFDSVECLAGFLNKKGSGADVASLWVVDFGHPSKLIDATRGFYLQSDKLNSPMGLNLTAFSDREAAAGMQATFPGATLTWPEVLKFVGQRWR
jgi:copper chaperone NosL